MKSHLQGLFCSLPLGPPCADGFLGFGESRQQHWETVRNLIGPQGATAGEGQGVLEMKDRSSHVTQCLLAQFTMLMRLTLEHATKINRQNA
jgi:hypothetical protein